MHSKLLLLITLVCTSHSLFSSEPNNRENVVFEDDMLSFPGMYSTYASSESYLKKRIAAEKRAFNEQRTCSPEIPILNGTQPGKTYEECAAEKRKRKKAKKARRALVVAARTLKITK